MKILEEEKRLKDISGGWRQITNIKLYEYNHNDWTKSSCLHIVFNNSIFTIAFFIAVFLETHQ